MLKHETGVSSLRRMFEQSDASQRRDELKGRIAREPRFDKHTLDTKNNEIREKKYIKVLTNDCNQDENVDKHNVTNTNSNAEYETKQPEEPQHVLVETVDKTTNVNDVPVSSVENTNPRDALQTKGQVNEYKNPESVKQSDTLHGQSLNPLLKEETNEDADNKNLNETTAPNINIFDKSTQNESVGHQISAHEGEKAIKQVTSKATMSTDQEKNDEDKFKEENDAENVDKRSDISESLNANAAEHKEKQTEQPENDLADEDGKVVNPIDICNIEHNSPPTLRTEGKAKDHTDREKNEVTQQESQQCAKSHLDTEEKENENITIKHVQKPLLEHKPRGSNANRTKEKPDKPPLPPKPTEHTTVQNTRIKSASNEVIENYNEGHGVKTNSRRFHRKLRLSRYDTRSSSSDSVISSSTTVSVDSVENDVRYMAEVYRPWIKHQIKVTDLLPLLNLEKEDIDIIKSKSKSRNSDAVDLLLDIITESDAPGIWQNFLDALETLEYIHISKLLKNETEIHHTHSTDILKLVTYELQQRICMPEFLCLVYQRRLLVASEYEKADTVFKTCGSQEAAKVIIESVDKHLPNWDVVFANILEQSDMKDIAELFRFVEQPPSNCTQIQEERFIETKKDKSKKQKLHERRIKDWERNTELQLKINEAGPETQSQTLPENKIINFNALCIAVSQIQSDLKTLSRGMENVKTTQNEILQLLQNKK